MIIQNRWATHSRVEIQETLNSSLHLSIWLFLRGLFLVKEHLEEKLPHRPACGFGFFLLKFSIVFYLFLFGNLIFFPRFVNENEERKIPRSSLFSERAQKTWTQFKFCRAVEKRFHSPNWIIQAFIKVENSIKKFSSPWNITVSKKEAETPNLVSKLCV